MNDEAKQSPKIDIFPCKTRPFLGLRISIVFDIFGHTFR